jgi:hypothetical protein
MKRTLAVALLVVLASCSSPGPTSSGPAGASTGPVSADRDKFVGTWAGSYSCGLGTPVHDTLVIALGGGALDFSITIHSTSANPDTVSGELTAPNQIKVPQQSMGGSPGTAEITSRGALLAYSQTGFGTTCGGDNYAKTS